jgi:hypothetical protein
MAVLLLGFSHVVAIDEIGVVNPADDWPNHINIRNYILRCLGDGIILDSEFLAVRKNNVPV